MGIINLKEFVVDLKKHNTFIVDGQLCLGGVITRNYEENGISVLSDFNHLKWIVRGWEISHIKRIERDSQDCRRIYKIIFDNNESRSVTASIRNDIGIIPAEDCGTDFLKLLDKDIFDDSKSFIVKDTDNSVAVIGLDLRRLYINEKQKQKIAEEMDKGMWCFDVPTEKEPSETLCLVVEINDFSFSFQALDVNTLSLKLLRISDDLHTANEKVKKYTQKMVAEYNSAYQNVKKNTDLIKELCEITETLQS